MFSLNFQSNLADDINTSQVTNFIRLLSHVWSHGLKHTRLPCPSLSSQVCSDLCPLSWWCYLAISSSIPFSSCLQSFTASGSFLVSQLFTSGGQSIGVSASTSALPMNIQDWFPLGWTGWISLESRGLSRILQHHSSKASNLWCSAFFTVQLSNPNTTTGKTIALTRQTFVVKVMSLLSALTLVSFRGCELLVSSYLGAADDMWLRSGD